VPMVFAAACRRRLGRGLRTCVVLHSSITSAVPGAAKSAQKVPRRNKKKVDRGDSWRRRKNAKLYRELEDSRFPPSSTARKLPWQQQKPEVLAPAGGWKQLQAAVRNGADAVYFGLDLGLNARARASNFTAEKLPQVMAYLHARGVKAFVTVNTLVFDHEFFGNPTDPRSGGGVALEVLRCLAVNHVDAVIMQDIGLALVCRSLYPSLPVHASTQMSVTSAAGALFAHELLGASRIVLGRELSVSEMSDVCRGAPGVEIEAFVHGALCVSYSGQCFSSEAWGGRSANRGQCAQACRMPYGLVRDGELYDLGDATKYLLSPQDLMALDYMPALIEAGVGCFKIEGRLKGEEYVALATASYRKAVDEAWNLLHAEVGDIPQSFGGDAAQLLSEPSVQHVALAQVFARGQDAEHDGLSPGFMDGPRHQHLVRGQAPKHRGTLVGTVVSMSGTEASFMLRLSSAATAVPLHRGAGLLFTSASGSSGHCERDEAGGSIRKLSLPDGGEIDSTEGLREGAEVMLWFDVPPGPNGDSMLERLRSSVQEEDLVWRSGDDTLKRKVRKMWLRGFPGMQVTAAVSGALGEPLVVKVADREGRIGVGRSDEILSQAKKHGLTASSLDPVLKLQAGCPPPDPEESHSEFDDSEVARGFWRYGAKDDGGAGIDTQRLESGLFMPKSQTQRARQRAVQDLLRQRLQGPEHAAAVADDEDIKKRLCTVVSPPLRPPPDWFAGAVPVNTVFDIDRGGLPGQSRALVPNINVLCRSRNQVDAVLALEDGLVHEVQLDFLEAQGLEDAVVAVRRAGRRVAVCLPRVLKPGEEEIWRFYQRLQADALVVRSAGALYQFMNLGSPSASSEAESQERLEHKATPALVGDFSLNAANVLSAGFFLSLPGVERLTPTHDLNVAQICALAKGVGASCAARLEVVAHQHLPIFHTEHCVFCRFLTKGNDYRDCGHPCEKGSLHLRDASGKDHRVLADMGCRNTVFNAEAQSAARDLKELAAAGVGFLRLELVDEPADAVGPLVERYHGALRGVVSQEELWEFVASVPDANGRPQGVSRGSLDGAAWRERAAEQLRPTAATMRSR